MIPGAVTLTEVQDAWETLLERGIPIYVPVEQAQSNAGILPTKYVIVYPLKEVER